MGYGKGKWGMAVLRISFKASAGSWTNQFPAHFILHSQWQSQVPYPWVGKVHQVSQIHSAIYHNYYFISPSHSLFNSFTPASNFTFLSLEFTSSGKPFPWHPQTRSHPPLSVVMGHVLFHSMWHTCNELFMQYLISDFPPRLQVLWGQRQHLLCLRCYHWHLENCLEPITYSVIM